MDKEREAICIIQDVLGNRDKQNIFDTDAQRFSIGGDNFLFTTDEYSKEDFFRENDPYTLGWNLTIATLSDILAAGGVPLFYGHSMTITSYWDNAFLKDFCRGINNCLSISEVKFLGGDTGFSDKWKYTGIVIGRQHTHIDRSGSNSGDIIYMTGKVGAGNLDAALKIYGEAGTLNDQLVELIVKFHYREKEAGIIRKHATSCIDSSDGVLKSLVNLAESSNLGFMADHLPYLKEGVSACKMLDLDKIMLFIGEGGEYELIFTIPENSEKDFLSDSNNAGIDVTRIGTMIDSKAYLLRNDGHLINFFGFDLHARNYQHITQYITAINKYLEQSSPGSE